MRASWPGLAWSPQRAPAERKRALTKAEVEGKTHLAGRSGDVVVVIAAGRVQEHLWRPGRKKKKSLGLCSPSPCLPVGKRVRRGLSCGRSNSAACSGSVSAPPFVDERDYSRASSSSSSSRRQPLASCASPELARRRFLGSDWLVQGSLVVLRPRARASVRRQA